jgi:hypothetical protein
MKEFIMSNGVVLLALVVAIIGLTKAVISKNKQKIYAEIYEFVTEAEKLEAANIDKFNFVFSLAYGKLPVFLKIFINKKDISRAIEYSLNKLKDFAKAQSVNTATIAISNEAATNTNNQSPADIAVNTEQTTAPIAQ